MMVNLVARTEASFFSASVSCIWGGMPLEVGGPPARSATGSGRAARKGFHWKAGGPRPPGPPRPPGGGRRRACAPRHSPVLSPQAFFNCEAPPRRAPGGLGGLGGLGTGTIHAQRASRLPSHRSAPPHAQRASRLPSHRPVPEFFFRNLVIGVIGTHTL